MNHVINLYVDDIRKCPDGFVIARNYDEAIELLRSNTIDTLSLDHDLGLNENGIEKNGYDIVKYMCEHGISPRQIYIHTDNVVGRDNMYYTLIGSRVRGFIESGTEIYKYGYTKNRI
ncbi:cyclic-phosphate processing receiver domain-containing protein [Clostridium sp. ZBS15]|uniref:cyclic-phosphate processing receiver domain-containing protein n=1 Tax=Clostridium sp. ZBS15 TaxID=2949969 RepID=UPI0020792E55|nr:cyclic-phosphate processing receiver domain-containing protein [Clostridium sp. ZBS15]